MMRILRKYLLREMILPFIFGVTAFTSIFVGTDVIFSLVNMVMDYSIELGVTLRLFLLSLPEIVVLTFPMSMLLASLLVFGRLSNSNELIAMKAGGISTYSMVLPVLIVALLVSLFTILINETVVPASQEMYNQLVWEIRHDEPLPMTQRHLVISPIDSQTGRVDFILYAYRFDGDAQHMEELTVHEYAGGQVKRIIEAKEAQWQDNIWQLKKGTIYEIDRRGRLPIMEFDTYTMQEFQRSPEEISRADKRPREMSMQELSSFIEMRREDGRDVSSLLVLYHQRFAIPFASFIFGLLGAPLGMQSSRSGSSIGLGLSIVIIFIYYAMMTIGSALGQNAIIPPFLGAWLQNFIFLLVGIVLLIKKAR